MKKTFLVMLMAGSSMAMFAQTTPTTTPTTPTTTPTSPTTNPTTNSSTTNGSVTNSTSDPMNTVTNPSLSNNSVNATGNTMNNGSWNNGTPPSWTWRSYGIWDPTINGSMNTTNSNLNTYNSVNGTTTMNSNLNNNTTANNINGTDMNSNMSSTNSYSAYRPVDNVNIPWNVQMNYSKEYPTASSSNGTWSQYGDWFYTTYMNNGRYSQIFYDQKGSGYSVALPVLNTYVPEAVVNNALQKYGSNLYSITMLKSSGGKDTYQINLLDRGQTKTEWLDESGTSVADVYRIDEMNTASTDMNTGTGTATNQGSMSTTEANAAMDNKQKADAKKSKSNVVNGSKTKNKKWN